MPEYLMDHGVQWRIRPPLGFMRGLDIPFIPILRR